MFNNNLIKLYKLAFNSTGVGNKTFTLKRIDGTEDSYTVYANRTGTDGYNPPNGGDATFVFTTLSSAPNKNYNVLSSENENNFTCSIFAGKGGGFATVDDVTLEDVINEGLEYSYEQVTVSYDEGRIIRSRVVNNTSSENIVITEIGLFGYLLPNTANNTKKVYMLTHYMLENPVTLQPGESTTLYVQITYNFQ